MIRCAAETDRLDIGRIYCRAWQAAYRGLVSDEFLDSLTDEGCAPPPGRIADGNCLVFEKEGAAVGLVNFGPGRDGDEMAEIRSIYVLPGCWRGGIGAELLKSAMVELKSRGYRRVFLWTVEGNARARSFYQKQGMQHTGFRDIEIAGRALKECRYEMEI